MPTAQLKSAQIAYSDDQPQSPNGEVITLVHGFVSSRKFNWQNTGWIDFLLKAGYRVISLDNRGHGDSEKFYNESDYSLLAMAGDVADLLNFLKVERTHIMGYSMGARISTMLTLNHGEIVDKLILAGNGYNMIQGTGSWAGVRDALLAPSIESVSDARAVTFRAFSDRTKGDNKALAACVMGAREMFTEQEFKSILKPALVAIGTKDDVAGDGKQLADLMPNGQYLPIPDRDHMRTVGDKVYMQGVLEFLQQSAL